MIIVGYSILQFAFGLQLNVNVDSDRVDCSKRLDLPSFLASIESH